MIHLITLNPAIDEYIELERFELGKTNYRKNTMTVMGGKAVNVATVLKNLGLNATLVTCIDISNKFVVSSLESYNSYLIEVDHIRTNLKINDNGYVTEINDRGHGLNPVARLQFETYMSKCVSKDDIVLIAGNPHTDDEEFQYRLARIAKMKGARLFLDSNKFNLDMIKALKPTFIKPNDEELELLATTAQSLASYVEELIVSHGKKGFTYYNQEQLIIEKPITGDPINPVGAGDSLIAGYIYGVANNLDLDTRLKLAKYCASATVFSGKLATLETIKQYDETNILS